MTIELTIRNNKVAHAQEVCTQGSPATYKDLGLFISADGKRFAHENWEVAIVVNDHDGHIDVYRDATGDRHTCRCLPLVDGYITLSEGKKRTTRQVKLGDLDLLREFGITAMRRQDPSTADDAQLKRTRFAVEFDCRRDPATGLWLQKEITLITDCANVSLLREELRTFLKLHNFNTFEDAAEDNLD